MNSRKTLPDPTPKREFAEIISAGCLLPYSGEAFAGGSLAEPMSCIIGGFRAAYHSGKEEYTHEMGIRAGGKMAILGGTGPMGLGAIDYALHGPVRPAVLVVTDINSERLARAEKIFPPEQAAKDGIELHFLNTSSGDARETLQEICHGKGFDDILCMAPVRSVVELADRILARDGCLNFFAGPMDPEFSAMFNFYNVHILRLRAPWKKKNNLKFFCRKAPEPSGVRRSGSTALDCCPGSGG